MDSPTNVCDIEIDSVKLERGEISTLANDPPMDYGKELAICQRYQFRTGNEWIYLRASRVTIDDVCFFLPLPVPMRVSPVIDASGLTISAFGGVSQTGFVFTTAYNMNGIMIIATKAAHGLSDADLIIKSRSLLDANL